MNALVRQVQPARPVTTYATEFVAVGAGIATLVWWLGFLLL